MVMKAFKFLNFLNALVCIIGVALIMVFAYYSWSENGNYNLVSFFGSLFIHGSLGVIVYLSIKWLLTKLLIDSENDDNDKVFEL